MYAIVRSGGRQHKVAVGDVLEIDKVEAKAGDSVALTPLLLVDGEKITADAENMTRMIAGMRPEYAVRLPDGRPVGAGCGTYATALEDMSAWRRGGYDARVVRRYTTEPEEA